MKRLPMRKIRDALRLRANGLTLREISESLGLGRTRLATTCSVPPAPD